MTRVVIVGNAGGGKSTLARRLSAAQGLPLTHLDSIQWRPGWVAAPAEEFARDLAAVLQRERWIVDGLASWETMEARFEAADTIIVVDLPLWRHYWWALKRQAACLFRPRPELPERCPMIPMTARLVRLMWRIHHTVRPKLLQLVEQYRPGRRIHHLRSVRAWRAFERTHCAVR